jgi:ribosomal protein L29
MKKKKKELRDVTTEGFVSKLDEMSLEFVRPVENNYYDCVGV